MRKYYSPLIGAALAAASLFQFSLPAFAAGTTAGTGLVNRATATYDDQENNSYKVTSNEVRVTVGKIAGITNVPIDFTDNTFSPTNTTILPRDSVSFDFEITNTGNDATDIFIPDASNITVENLTDLEVSYVTVDSDGNEVVTPRGGDGFENGIIQDVDENTSIVIRVTGNVSDTAGEGDSISVQLGDTGTNTADVNSTDYLSTQNQPDLGANNDVQNRDVRTQTADGEIVAVSGPPVNGQREASAKDIKTIGSESLALARLEKTNAGVDDGADESVLTDNIITYNLNLEVAGTTDPQVAAYTDFPFNAEDLEGRDYSGQFNFDGATTSPANQTNLILVSDAIPVNTQLDPSSVVAPTGWTVVYTTDALTVAADDADWVATAPDASTITRVGWVYDAGSDGALAAGSSTTGFEFQVVTVGITDNTATAVYNIAQVFGTTNDGADGTSGLITYDESGDQNPANLNDDGTFGPDETATTDVDGEDFFGYADPDTVDGDGDPEDNVDLGNDNSATGSVAGEVNKVIVSPVATVSELFNGPDSNADAVGDIFEVNPADDNHDFQNLAAQNPGENNPLEETDDDSDGYFVSTYDPESVIFTNTVSNPSQGTINNIILEPIAADELNLGGDNTDLPVGTAVIITYDDGVTVQTARYVHTAPGVFTIDTDNSDGTGTNGTVVIPNIPRNSEESYEVRINLPAGTQLSTDFEEGNPANELVGAYPAVIAAYIDDDDADSDPATTELTVDDTYNVTVNQIYTGYLQLVKKARVLRDNGSGTYAEVAGMGFDDPNSVKQPAPGDLLEYQITYTNISDEGGSGTGNGLLQADDVVITEDGTTGGNNWAVDNDDPAEDGDDLIDTLHPLSGANDSTSGSVITYFDESGTGNTDPGTFSNELVNFEVTDDIVRYEVSGITRLEPGEFGVFTFQRKITSPADIEDLTP